MSLLSYKKKFILLAFISFLNSFDSSSQKIFGKINNSNSGYIILYSFYGTALKKVDSCQINKKGKYVFPSNYLTGFYRLSYNDKFFDFILNSGTTIEMNFNTKDISTGPLNKVNKENEAFKTSNQLAKKTNQQITQIKERELDDSIKSVLISIEFKNYQKSLEKLISENTGTYFASTSIALLEPVYSDSLAKIYISKLLFMQEHFFDRLDFKNENLCRSTVLPNMFMRYFENYVNYDETGFKFAIEYMLTKAASNSQVYEFTLVFLLKLFSTNGPEIIFEYLVEKYYKSETACFENKEIDLNLINKILLLSIGNKIPDYKIYPEKSIAQICLASELTLLLFWSSECHFCEMEIPQIDQILGSYTNNQIQLISINLKTTGDSKNIIKSCSKSNCYFINETLGFNAEIAQLFNINKTPTLFLLDKNSLIIGKNIFNVELKNLINKKLN